MTRAFAWSSISSTMVGQLASRTPAPSSSTRRAALELQMRDVVRDLDVEAAIGHGKRSSECECATLASARGAASLPLTIAAKGSALCASLGDGHGRHRRIARRCSDVTLRKAGLRTRHRRAPRARGVHQLRRPRKSRDRRALDARRAEAHPHPDRHAARGVLLGLHAGPDPGGLARRKDQCLSHARARRCAVVARNRRDRLCDRFRIHPGIASCAGSGRERGVPVQLEASRRASAAPSSRLRQRHDRCRACARARVRDVRGRLADGEARLAAGVSLCSAGLRALADSLAWDDAAGIERMQTNRKRQARHRFAPSCASARCGARVSAISAPTITSTS